MSLLWPLLGSLRWGLLVLTFFLVVWYLHSVQPDACDPRGSTHVCAESLPPGSLVPVQGVDALPGRVVRFGVDFSAIHTNPLGLSASCIVASEATAAALCGVRP